MEKNIEGKGSRLRQSLLFALIVYILPVNAHEKQSNLIYILEWTYTYHGPDYPYRNLEMGQEAFTSRNCSLQNCFITSDRSYFHNVTDYDVVIMNAVHYTHFPLQNFELPAVRSEIQLYILLAVEPAAYHPIPNYLNGKIDLTWTYKLNSDIVHPYLLVKNNVGEIVGPKPNVHWLNINDLPPTNTSVIQKLKNKRLAAMWIASNCYSKSRILYIHKLDHELRSKYGLQVDIFGKCGNYSACTSGTRSLDKCYKIIESDYYFYLAFENSNSEDYVSKKVLHGLKHFTVPIVYGAADYKRFMPDGIYLDATNLKVERLAKEMYDIINDPPRYYDFFRWHGYYTFHDTSEDGYRFSVCELCAFLNEEKRHRTVRVYQNIVGWWNVPAPDDFPMDSNAFRKYYEQYSSSSSVTDQITVYEPKTEPKTTISIVSLFFDYLFD